MKTLYLDLSMGAAGDMLAASLIPLLPNPEEFITTLNQLGLPGVTYTLEPSVKCGITGSHLTVTVHGQEEGEHLHEHSHDHHDHPHSHNGLHEIRHLVKEHITLPNAVLEHVLAVYDLLAQAESQVHGVPMEEIHFHEVGTLDAIADITAVCYALHLLAPEEIVASPIHVGAGQVRCAHGILPVPAPATTKLLTGIPIYSGTIQGELCTPTGAALLKHFVTRFGPMPTLTVEAMGYGMGKKDFEAANCVRSILGYQAPHSDTVISLACNLDDMTPEALGFAQEQLWEMGALEVYTTPIGMKKNRPGVLLTCLCKPCDAERCTQALLRHTATLGVRRQEITRTTLPRRFETCETPYGPVRMKYAGDKKKPEYEDLAKIAREQHLTLAQVEALLS